MRGFHALGFIILTFLTLLLCSAVRDGVTWRMRAGGDYRTCVALCSGLKPFQVHCGIHDHLILRTIRSEQLCRTRSCLLFLSSSIFLYLDQLVSHILCRDNISAAIIVYVENIAFDP